MPIARRPFDGSWEITGDTATHASYGVGPASDYNLDTGTPLKAPIGGKIATWFSPAGGKTTRITAFTAVGYAQVFLQHQSDYTANINDGICVIGEHIGYSGNTGGVTSGPHLHSWVELDGVRITMELFMAVVGDREYQLGQTVGGPSFAGGDLEIIPEKPKPSGVPMFNLVSVPDAGLIFVQGIDGRREGVQSVDHLVALRQYRDAMLTPGPELVMYFGDLVGQRGSIDWYLARVNGPRDAAAATSPAPYKFTADELAKIGSAVTVNVSGIAAQITALDAQADDYQTKLTALLNREFVLSPKL